MPNIDIGLDTISNALNLVKEKLIDHLKEWTLMPIKSEQIEVTQEDDNDSRVVFVMQEHLQGTLASETLEVEQRYGLRR